MEETVSHRGDFNRKILTDGVVLSLDELKQPDVLKTSLISSWRKW